MDTDRQADKHKQMDSQTQADSISETCHELDMKRDLLAGRAPSTDMQTSVNPTPMRAVTDDAIYNFQLCSKHWHIAASFATHYLKQAKSKTYNLTFSDLCCGALLRGDATTPTHTPRVVHHVGYHRSAAEMTSQIIHKTHVL